MMNWEQIDDYTQRAKVYRGWLVKIYENVRTVLPDGQVDFGHEWRVAMAFIPDPLHAWKP